MVKKIFLLLILIFICNMVTAQEEKPLPNLIVSDDDYLTTRNNKQGDSQNNAGPYNGYYTPDNTREPFNFRSDKNFNNYPGNESSGDGYSGYYENTGFKAYQFPEEKKKPVPAASSNAIELSGNDFLDGVDIKSGGIPVWKQTNSAVVEVDKIRDMNVSVFLLTQQKNKNVIGYNVEFRSNREVLAFTSFILEGKSTVSLLNKEDSNNQVEQKIGTFMTEVDPSGTYQKIMTFSYKGKEIKLKMLEEGKIQNKSDIETLQENNNVPVEHTEDPVIESNKIEPGKSNTVIEVNF